jgi:deoxyribodipyrimidine photo-lyase
MAADKKRTISDQSNERPTKRNQTNGSGAATIDLQNGASVETPYQHLLRILNDHQPKTRSPNTAKERGVVVWWMRMRDLRLSDNRALAVASQLAEDQSKHLVVLHVLSPGDYRSHDRSPRRIDFVLRNLIDLRRRLGALNIPLYTTSIEPRQTIPEKIIQLISTWGACYLTANIEHEVSLFFKLSLSH